MDFDRLNQLGFDAFAEEYFGEMEITKEQKDERVDVSKKVRELMLLIFTLIDESKSRKALDEDHVLEYFREELTGIVSDELSLNDDVKKYIDDVTDDVLYATLINTGAYWLSEQRASVIGLNEANTIRGYGDLEEAIDAGYTKKKWVTMRDDKVRITHSKVDGMVKSIDGYFEVGDDLMLYPHDYVNGSADETVNCRCSLVYL